MFKGAYFEEHLRMAASEEFYTVRFQPITSDTVIPACLQTNVFEPQYFSMW